MLCYASWDSPYFVPGLPHVSLSQVDTVGNIVQTLQQFSHNGFPVVSNAGHSALRGLVLRNQVLVLLQQTDSKTPARSVEEVL